METHNNIGFFKVEKLWSMINGIEPNLMYLTPTQLAIGMPPLPTIGIVSISALDVKNTLSLTLINKLSK